MAPGEGPNPIHWHSYKETRHHKGTSWAYVHKGVTIQKYRVQAKKRLKELNRAVSLTLDFKEKEIPSFQPRF